MKAGAMFKSWIDFENEHRVLSAGGGTGDQPLNRWSDIVKANTEWIAINCAAAWVMSWMWFLLQPDSISGNWCGHSPCFCTNFSSLPWFNGFTNWIKAVQKGLEKEEREKERTFPQKVFPARIWLLHNRLRNAALEKGEHYTTFNFRIWEVFSIIMGQQMIYSVIWEAPELTYFTWLYFNNRNQQKGKNGNG